MTVINKSAFCGNLNGARLLGHPVYTVNLLSVTESIHQLATDFSNIDHHPAKKRVKHFWRNNRS